MSKAQKNAKDSLRYLRVFEDLWLCPTFQSLSPHAQIFFLRLCGSYNGGPPQQYQLSAPYKLFKWRRSRTALVIEELVSKRVIQRDEHGGLKGAGGKANTYRLTAHFEMMARFGQKRAKRSDAIVEHGKCSAEKYRSPRRKTTKELNQLFRKSA